MSQHFSRFAEYGKDWFSVKSTGSEFYRCSQLVMTAGAEHFPLVTRGHHVTLGA
jgi:hypothetical protein